jgi:hypothetical protein
MRLPSRHLAAVVALALVPQGGQAARLAPHNAEIDHEFTRIVGVRELGPDRVLVADGGENVLSIADWRDGTARTVGRTGRGPGEYASVSGLFAIAGDSSLLVDQLVARWLLLSGDSIVVTISPDDTVMEAGGLNALGADALGHVIATRPIRAPGGFRPTGTTPRADSSFLVRFARRTGGADTLLSLGGRAARINISGTTDADRTIRIEVNPIAAGDASLLFPDGWIAIARVSPYRVDWIAPGSPVRRGAPLPFEKVPVTEREKRAVMARLAADRGTPLRDPAGVVDWPEVLPPFLQFALVAAENGRIWILRVRSADHPETVYDVVDRRGALVTRYTMSGAERVVGVGRHAVYIAFTDDDGIQHLRRHPLPRY